MLLFFNLLFLFADLIFKEGKDIFTDIAEVQRLNKISSAFITFNETDSHDKALSMKRHECTLMRQHVKFTEPPEPTNVQWENKQLSKNDIKPLARLFQEINTSHNGHISKDELTHSF